MPSTWLPSPIISSPSCSEPSGCALREEAVRPLSMSPVIGDDSMSDESSSVWRSSCTRSGSSSRVSISWARAMPCLRNAVRSESTSRWLKRGCSARATGAARMPQWWLGACDPRKERKRGVPALAARVCSASASALAAARALTASSPRTRATMDSARRAAALTSSCAEVRLMVNRLGAGAGAREAAGGSMARMPWSANPCSSPTAGSPSSSFCSSCPSCWPGPSWSPDTASSLLLAAASLAWLTESAAEPCAGSSAGASSGASAGGPAGAASASVPLPAAALLLLACAAAAASSAALASAASRLASAASTCACREAITSAEMGVEPSKARRMQDVVKSWPLARPTDWMLSPTTDAPSDSDRAKDAWVFARRYRRAPVAGTAATSSPPSHCWDSRSSGRSASFTAATSGLATPCLRKSTTAWRASA
mmetsp:Transcript_2811/g.11302  ORF Transcript_2811/g.11302 Transcript_2811/m.11302 type:complete len:425 (-) Transcript_2811:314-1588(-)